ncbi:rho guanyl nucleotide exchange factor [Histoplasma capsulatum]|uniref:Rho guanyl nucleotide exchange factor n=1 Tax=Ajellomyces capsulatus TaxID=5037 RepID=A0A8A1MI39_AJECA|nr:rho guanyl nucleotide exchange factor [Histoplasma capsulatum]
METESVVGLSSVDSFSAEEFASVLSNRLNNVLRPLHQPENPILTSAILNTNFNIIRSIASYILEHAKSGRGFRPPSPSKLLSNFWNGSPKGSLPPPRSLFPAPILREIPQILPPALDHSNTLATPPKTGNGGTLIGVSSGEGTSDIFKSLEETFSAYVIAIRSRSGNIVGRILRMRRQADPATINELYNALLEDAGKIQLAAESPVDVLFVAFETFMANSWNEHIGPIIPPDAWEPIQSKFDSMSPGGFENYFHQFLTEMSPQNRRALTVLVKLLAELLDASGNDGDRGALTATFSEILTDKGNAMEHISLLDRLVEDFDRLFDESSTPGAPIEGILLNDHASPFSRAHSMNNGSTNHGSISSNTSSLRKRFGFGSTRDRGKSESEGKVSSIIRTLSKSKAHGETDSQPSSFSKASIFRSRSIDIDSRLNSLLRPVSRERLLAHGIFSASAEDQSLRPNSAHSNAPTLASIGEHPTTDKPVTIRKKRRSSLSDLKALPATNVSTLLPPIDLRRPLTPASPPNATTSLDPSSPLQQADKTGPQTLKKIVPATSSPSRPLVSSSKENAPPTPRTTLGNKVSNRKSNSAIPLQLSPKRRSEGLSFIPSPRNNICKDRVVLPNPTDMYNGRPQSSSSIPRTPKLRMQNPQKLRERLQNEKKAIASAESAIKAEISSLADEISTPRLSPVRRRPGTPRTLASSPPTSSSTTTLHSRSRSIEAKVNTLLSELSSRTSALEKDIEDSLLVSERRAKKLDELYREASAENSALYERFNVELSKVTKEVRLGAGEEALKSQLKEALDEVARVKKENLRLKREIGGLKAQQLGFEFRYCPSLGRDGQIDRHLLPRKYRGGHVVNQHRRPDRPRKTFRCRIVLSVKNRGSALVYCTLRRYFCSFTNVVGSHYVAKFGKGVNLIEGENMLFVQEMTKIPVPRVYALYSNPQTCKNYIVMEHIAGETLAKLWASLTYAEKESIVAKLCDYYKELMPAAITRNTHMMAGLLIKQIFTANVCHTFSMTTSQHLLMVQRKNIMIRSNPQHTTAGNQALELVILDWEKSGWYPSYWEYCLAVCALRWDDDWGLWIEKMLDPFIPENCGPRTVMFSNGSQRLTPQEYNGASEPRLPCPQHGHSGWVYARTFARMREQ